MAHTPEIAPLLPFMAPFEAGEVPAGRWHGGDGVFPYFEYSKPVDRLVHALYKHGWIGMEGFAWGEWQDEAARYVNDPSLVASADITTIRRLLTTHVRKDRFCEGHLSIMIWRGHIGAILRRLHQIHDEATGTARHTD